MGVLALVGGGLCALFLGVLGGDERPPDPTGAGPPEDVPPAAGPTRLQGLDAVRAVARTVREVRVQTQDEATAAAMGRQYLDRVLPEDPRARRELLIEALGDADDDVRWIALSGVFRYGPADPRLAKILIARARDETGFVREAALAALRAVRRAEAGTVAHLEATLPSASGALWAALVHALLNIQAGDPSALAAYKPRFLRALDSTQVDVRRAAAYGLARIDLSPVDGPYPHADARARMIRALDDADSDVRMWIAQGLSRMLHEGAPAVEALVERLADDAPHVADWAKAALGEIGRPALPAVERVLAAGDRRRASGAVYVLRRVGGPQAVRVLREGLEHPDPVFRVRSMMALRDLRIEGLEPIRLYIAVLTLDDLDALRLALEGLSRLGADARPARDAVAALADHSDDVVRLKARSILAAVDQRSEDR